MVSAQIFWCVVYQVVGGTVTKIASLLSIATTAQISAVRAVLERSKNETPVGKVVRGENNHLVKHQRALMALDAGIYDDEFLAKCLDVQVVEDIMKK